MFELTTLRLILKPHTMANAELMNAWTNDPELLYFDDDLPEPYRHSPMERTHAFIQRNLKPSLENETLHWGIHLRDSDRMIGYCMAAFIDPYHRKCKFGMTIGDKSVWGQGYGREVVDRIVAFCFETLNMNRIQCEIYDFNERSIRLFESAGFRREGTCRQSVLKKGHYVDEHVYGLLKEDWEAR